MVLNKVPESLWDGDLVPHHAEMPKKQAAPIPRDFSEPLHTPSIYCCCLLIRPPPDQQSPISLCIHALHINEASMAWEFYSILLVYSFSTLPKDNFKPSWLKPPLLIPLSRSASLKYASHFAEKTEALSCFHYEQPPATPPSHHFSSDPHLLGLILG